MRAVQEGQLRESFAASCAGRIPTASTQLFEWLGCTECMLPANLRFEVVQQSLGSESISSRSPA